MVLSLMERKTIYLCKRNNFLLLKNLSLLSACSKLRGPKLKGLFSTTKQSTTKMPLGLGLNKLKKHTLDLAAANCNRLK